MSIINEKNPGQVKKKIDQFPLKAILGLFAGENTVPDASSLVKHVLKEIVWASSQTINMPSRYSYSIQTTVLPKGPILLLGVELAKICETFGWKQFEETLVDAIDKMCLYNSVESAVALTEEIAPKASSHTDSSERMRVCTQMASIACEKMLKNSASTSSPLKPASYKSLVKVIGRFCLSCASEFVSFAKKLDIDTIIFPLVSDVVLRSTVSDIMTDSLDSLLYHCVEHIAARISNGLGIVNVWAIEQANLSRQPVYSSFLRSPCKQEYDWQVRKADHKVFF